MKRNVRGQHIRTRITSIEISDYNSKSIDVDIYFNDQLYFVQSRARARDSKLHHSCSFVVPPTSFTVMKADLLRRDFPLNLARSL